jgi:hypothetical protein
MRVGLACFALAAAIGTPGLVVGAISSGPNAVRVGSIVDRTAILTPESPGPPIAPELRPVVNALKEAFAAQGTTLVAAPIGAHEAEAFSFTPGVKCPLSITISYGQPVYPFQGQASCRSSTIHFSTFQIDYSPRSAGPTIEKAFATLR